MINEILSSISLLLATIALLYSSWQQDIRKARELKIPQHYIDGRVEHNFLKETLWKKAVPLCVATILITLTFLPEMVRVILLSLRNISCNGIIKSMHDYNAMETTLILVTVALFLFSSHLFSISSILYKKHLDFEKKKEDQGVG